MEKKAQKRLMQAWIGGILVTLVLQWIPFGGLALYPFTLLNTYIHEGMHALAGIATGGSVHQIVINSDGSGVTLVQGGWAVVTGSAGYVGAALFGGVILLFSRTEKQSRAMHWALVGFMALITLIWVRGGLVGLGVGLLWIAGLAVLAKKGDGNAVFWFAQFIGIQQVSASLGSLRDLNLITRHNGGATDALFLQEATGLPAMLWVIGWVILSLLILVACIRSAWQNAGRTGNNPLA